MWGKGFVLDRNNTLCYRVKGFVLYSRNNTLCYRGKGFVFYRNNTLCYRGKGFVLYRNNTLCYRARGSVLYRNNTLYYRVKGFVLYGNWVQKGDRTLHFKQCTLLHTQHNSSTQMLHSFNYYYCTRVCWRHFSQKPITLANIQSGGWKYIL